VARPAAGLAAPTYSLPRFQVLLMPFEPLFFAVDPDCEVVLFTDGYLACVQDSSCAVVEAKQAVAVVVEPAALDEDAQICADLFDLEACDIFGEVLGVRADVTHTAGPSALLGIGSPGGLLLARLLQSRGQPALRILNDDLADLADLAAADEVSGELDHRVAGVVVHQAEDPACLVYDLLELLCLGDVEGHRLLAHYVESGLEEIFGNGEMPVVGRGDADEIDSLAVWELELLLDHLLVGSIGPFRGDHKLPSHLL